jgi:hypothetical protein
LSEAASTIFLLTQENQAADHLISRHGDWNLTIEAAALIAVAIGVYRDQS